MIFTKRALYGSTISLLLSFLTHQTWGQNQATIKGTVQDSTQARPLPYATVGLYQLNNQQKPLRNIFTDSKGRYTFSKVDTGRYIIFATNSGFGEKGSLPIHITGSSAEIEIPALQLGIASTTLAAFTLTARKPLIEHNEDKLTYNVEADPSNAAQTATDVMRKTPFLSVDGEGNVQLNGQSNFKVLLNGKETAMFSRNVKEALQSFPANLIKSIEVITTPSAKYDGEGVGGIINIITKKKIVGYNGNIGVFRTTLGNTNLNSNASFKFGKFGISGYYGINQVNGIKFRNAAVTESFNPVAYSKRISKGNRTMNNFYNYGNLELSWDVDSLNTLSGYGSLTGGSNKNHNDRYFDVVSPNGQDTARTLFDDQFNYSYPSRNWGTDFIHKFRRNKEQELTIKMFHDYSNDKNLQNSDQQSPNGRRSVINDNKSINRQSTYQLDYIHPFKNKIKLETGLKAILRHAEADYVSQQRFSPDEKFVIDTTNSDNFNYRQNVFGGYATLRFAIKKFNFRIGARIEQTVVDGDFVKSHTTVNQDYITLMPSFFVSRKFGTMHTLSLSYSKRLSRPYIWDLNPFVNNTDSLSLNFGNPNLSPELYHSVELGWTVLKGKTNINIRLSENFSNTQIARYSYFNDQTGVTYYTSDNIGSYSSTGLSGNVSVSPTAKWRISSNIGLRYDFVKNRRNPAQRNNGLGGYGNINSSYDITKKISAFANANLNRAPAQLQGYYGLNYWYSFGSNFKMLKEKLTLTININNIFRKDIEWKSSLGDKNFHTTSWNYRPGRSASIGLRWNFGKLTESVSRKRGVNNDDLRANSN
ncbi:TonB-dependent receptor [Paraflavitalea sp. CAU 1676]|uniref:TonB-dependent receptor n=1 Tax=Paraflavitalea sp. CAU 1676 TaxID=3032598 RepID=UPI0023DC8EA7|nr:TonB-dependent receptor [Paraflavitalea sp. CAU 1676]MDF2190813.1 TonB-dependent receptor [Paraflavitalea sp. CAU 1676]